LFVLFAKGVCMCTYPDPSAPASASALREHMYPPTPTHQSIYLSTYLIHPLTLSFPSHHLPPSLSHTSLRITPPPHLPNPSTQHRPTPHHTIPTPSVPQPSEQAHQAHQARRQPSPPVTHVRARLPDCNVARRRGAASVSVCVAWRVTGTGGECKIAIGAAARGHLRCVALRCVALRVRVQT
jgi:hypothetical protein